MKKFFNSFILFALLGLIFSGCEKEENNYLNVQSNEQGKEKEKIKTNPKDKAGSLVIKISTGMSTVYTLPCMKAWDICLEIYWLPSESSINIDGENQTLTLTIDTSNDPTFYAGKTSSGQFEFVDDLIIPSDISDEFNVDDIFIEEGFYDYTMNGDLLTITTSYSEI